MKILTIGIMVPMLCVHLVYTGLKIEYFPLLERMRLEYYGTKFDSMGSLVINDSGLLTAATV